MTTNPNSDATNGTDSESRTTGRRTVSNPERGCGHLKPGKAYARGVVGSPGGTLPSFVKCDPPIPYREMGTEGAFTRGYLRFNGVDFEAATVSGPLTTYRALYPGDADDQMAAANLADQLVGWGPGDIEKMSQHERRTLRLTKGRLGAGDHFGDVDAGAQTDLLMRAGKSHYPDPDAFVTEAKRAGISKAIPLSKSQDPPTVVPGLTRMWIVHPDVDGEWAVLGYGYLQEVVYTAPDDGNVPSYIQDYADAGKLDVVDIGPPGDPVVTDQDDRPEADLVNDFEDAAGTDGSAADTDPEEGQSPDANPGGEAVKPHPKTDAAADPPVWAASAAADLEAAGLISDQDFDAVAGTVAATTRAMDPSDDPRERVRRVDAAFATDLRDIDADDAADAWGYWYDAREPATRFNDLRVIASKAPDVDAGESPTADELMTKLADAGIFPVHAPGLLPVERRADDQDTDG